MVVGVIVAALGLKKVLGYVGGQDGHTLADHLHGVPLIALYGGAAMYLLALVAFKYRTIGQLSRVRLGAGMVLLALIPVAESVQINPWLAVIAILSLGVSWHVPSQSPEYLVAYGATHGRLYSHLQARKMAFAYEGIALAGLALSLPYWHVLGYL